MLYRQSDGPEEVLDLVAKTAPDKFVLMFLNSFELKERLNSIDDYDEIKKALTKSVDEEDKINYIVSLIKSPVEFKERVYLILKKFYNKFFKERQTTVRRILKDKINKHKKMYEENPQRYLEYTTGFKVEDLKTEDCHYIHLLLIYHGEFFLYLKPGAGNRTFIIYGAALEQRFNRQLKVQQSKLLFKVLAD